MGIGKVNWHSVRIALYWGAAISCLIALLVNSNLPERAIVTAVLLLGLFVTAATYEHGLFKAPTPIGMIPRAILLLCSIWGMIASIAWYEWPPPSFVYIKPGVALNAGLPNGGWTFHVIVRGPQPIYNVDIGFDDAIRRDQINRDIKSATSDEERLRLINESAALGQRLHYSELDQSPSLGTDNEITHFVWPTGQQRRLRYDIYISYRGGAETEHLEIYSPQDRIDWQFKMTVTNNDKVLINCRDPRFPKSADETDLPQCFPEYGGRLPK